MRSLVLTVVVFVFAVAQRGASNTRRSLPSGALHVRQGNCSTCADKGACCGAETCCGNPSVCCGAGLNCCDGECCEDIETCCPDKTHGSICCIAENTFCCAATPLMASHCCPHWNVCCPGGRYGCCDPGNLRASEDNFAYALFSKASFEGGEPMSVLKIDLNTGAKIEILTTFNTYGEITRSFIFAPSISSFVLPQADFLSPSRNVSIWRISVQGPTSRTVLTGAHASGLVTGFCWASDISRVVFATYNADKTGYLFYRSDPVTGVTVSAGNSSFGSQDNWAGWFKRCSSDGSTLYRLGYQDVINEVNFGVGVTRLGSNAVVSTVFVPLLSPAGLSIYGSIDVLTNSTFLSVAGEGNQDGDYAVVQWDLSGNAKIVAKLTNAHDAVKFGPISTSLNPEKTQFAAVTTTRNLLGDKYDRWGITLLSLSSYTVKQHELSPWMIAETDSVAGVGFLIPQSRGLR